MKIGNGEKAARMWDGQIMAAALDGLPDSVLVFDAAERLVYWNARLAEFLPAFTVELEAGLPLAEVEARLDAIDRGMLLRELARNDGGGYTLVLRRERRANGLESSIATIFRYSPDGVAMLDGTGQVSHANDALTRLLGWAPGSLVGTSFAGLIHPDHRGHDMRKVALVTSGALDHVEVETRYLRHGQDPFRAKMSVSLVDGGAAQRLAMVVIEDIEGQKQAEESLSVSRAMIETSSEAIAVYGVDGHVLYANAAYAQLFGLAPAAVAGHSFSRQFVSEGAAVITRIVLPALERDGSWEGVLDAHDRSGRVFPLWQRLGTVRDPSTGAAIIHFAFMHDHSARQRVEDELNRAKTEAENANRAKTRFLAAASHDLRQPLQALGMFVAVLAGRETDPATHRLIASIEDSVNALDGLLSGLLDVSKLEAGLVMPHIGAFGVSSLMNRLAEEFRPQAEAAGLSWRMVRSQARVVSDQTLLERMLRNLLSNAVRYTGRGRISFGCRRRGGMLRFEIRDTGVGIPESETRRIFEEFHQLDNPARDRRKGLGLGLAIVDRLSRLLGHKVEVASRLGKGSLFAIEVPLAEARPSLVSDFDPAGQGLDIKGASVLLIEDEPDVLESIRLLLSSWGYRVIPASGAEAALEALAGARFAPDLVLADYRLAGGQTGGQAIQRVAQHLGRPVPAVILTGDTAPERLKMAQSSGHLLLHKPIRAQTLRRVISETIAGSVDSSAKRH